MAGTSKRGSSKKAGDSRRKNKTVRGQKGSTAASKTSRSTGRVTKKTGVGGNKPAAEKTAAKKPGRASATAAKTRGGAQSRAGKKGAARAGSAAKRKAQSGVGRTRPAAAPKGAGASKPRRALAKPAKRAAPKPAATRPSSRQPAAPKPAAPKPKRGLSTIELARERVAGQAKRTVRRALGVVAGAIAAARPSAPTPPPARPSPSGRPAPTKRVRGRTPRPAAVAGVVVKGKTAPRYPEILSPGALAFLAELHRRFDTRRRELLAARAERQRRFDAGELPDFLSDTRHVRESDWAVGPIPKDLFDRRVEITGPVDRKMIVNALNSGATHFMADFEDANSPTWANNIEGQLNLKDRWDGKIAFTDDASGKRYDIGAKPAVLIVRPRGWHLLEEHVTVDREPISGSLFDFGLYFFHNAKNLRDKGSGPYFYLPKLESHHEARLWNEVFVYAQEKLSIPRGTIKATVLIETLPAAFEMDEILYELREHAAGLNAGRWDFIVSVIKTFAKRSEYVLPDRGQVVMGKAFLGAYSLLLIKTCHHRRAFAMGGMAAQIPIKGDAAANEAAFAKVRADKEREVRDGHDGTWVAHPDLVPVAKDVFDRMMPQPNQLDRLREDVHVTRDDLLEIHDGTKTEEGFRLNLRVGVQYIESWLRGRGAAPIYNLMEDAATAEISRAQIWQWLRYGAVLDNGVKITPEFFARALDEEMQRVKSEVGAEAFAEGRFPEAIALFRKLSLAPEFEDFLTIPAYKLIA
ncbi:MAG: malate synthase A [Rhodoplanes sp.]